MLGGRNAGRAWSIQTKTSTHYNSIKKHSQLGGTETTTAGAGRFGHVVAGRTIFGVALVCGLVGVAPTQQRLVIP